MGRAARVLVLTLGGLSIGVSATAQDPAADAEPAPVFVPSERTLAVIERALQGDPVITDAVEGRRFFLQVVARPVTWQEYMAGSNGMFAITPIRPPDDRPGGDPLGGGSGIDLLGIFRSVGQAMRDREVRQIRERIDRELLALEAAREAPR